MSIKLRKKNLKNGYISLYLDIYLNGKRKYEFLGMQLGKNKQQNKELLSTAENIRAKRELELFSNQHGLIPQFKKKVNFVEYFLKVSETKPKTYKRTYLATHKILKEFTNGYLQISNIDDEWLEAFKNHLLDKCRIDQNTVHLYFTKIKAVLNEAVREKLILSNPAKFVKNVKIIQREKDYLTAEDLQILANANCKNKDVKKAFLFACYTGLRLSDVKKLIWGNIKNNSVQYRQKKTGQAEYLPLSETASKLITSANNIIPLPTNLVFDLPSETWLRDILVDWGKEAKLEKKLKFHTARHTFATLALTNGADLYTISKLLGHSTIQHTQIYAKIVDEKKNDAVNLIPGIVL